MRIGITGFLNSKSFLFAAVQPSPNLNRASSHSESVMSAINPGTYGNGVKAFAKLFTRFMDSNEWSHPVMTMLARSALGGTSWLHSSQISGLRHAKLVSPGPRTFLAIAELNRCLHLYLTENKRIPGTTSSDHYVNGYCVLEDGIPPPPGWWFEVFCGVRVPKDIDLNSSYYSEEEAAVSSKSWAKRFRRLMSFEGYDIYEDLGNVLRLHYPAKDVDRLELIERVIKAQDVWTPEQFINEKPALLKLSAALGGPQTEEELMEDISQASSVKT